MSFAKSARADGTPSWWGNAACTDDGRFGGATGPKAPGAAGDAVSASQAADGGISPEACIPAVPKDDPLARASCGLTDLRIANARAMASDGTHIFLVSQDGLERARIDGTEQTLLVPGMPGRDVGIVVKNEHVYWISGPQLLSVPKVGGSPTLLYAARSASNFLLGLNIVDNFLYLYEEEPGPRNGPRGPLALVQISPTGTARIITAADGREHVGGAGVPGSPPLIYWTVDDTLFRRPLFGGVPVEVARWPGTPVSLLGTDGTHVYVSIGYERTTGPKVARILHNGRCPETINQLPPEEDDTVPGKRECGWPHDENGTHYELHGDYIYRITGAVRRLPKEGGRWTVLAHGCGMDDDDFFGPILVAIDDRYAYFGTWTMQRICIAPP